jgi:large subunit ribosomal protein L9
MKILLLQDIKGVGKKGEIKDVSDGYAQNAILPKNKGLIATDQVVKKYELERSHKEAGEKIQKELAEKTFKDLASKSLIIEANASDKGHLFASIHAPEIMLALKDQFNLSLNPDWIELKHPIKEVGEYKLKLHAHGINGVLNVEVK